MNPRALGVALLVVLALQCFGSMRLKSPIYDEPIYLVSGYAGLTTGVELNPAQPPLMKYLIAIPLVLVGSSPAAAIPKWDNAVEERRTYSLLFLFQNRVPADTLLFAGRTAVVLVSILLAVLVWIWSSQLYGPWAGIVALAFYCFNPDVIAHSTLATLDLGVSAGVAVASYALWQAYRLPTAARGVAAGVALAAALLVKATALLVLALLPVFLAAAYSWREPRAKQRSGRDQTSSRARTMSSLLRTTFVALSTAALVIAVAYGPHRFGLREYVEGFNLGFFHRDAFMDRNYQFFAWGQYSKSGFWWYFLAAYLVKAPIVMLAATVALPLWFARRAQPLLFGELFLVLPAAAFFIATMFITDAMGVRYLLPAYPLLFVLFGGLVVDVARTIARGLAHSQSLKRVSSAAGAILAASYIGGSLWIYPDYVAYFNGLFCGPAQGIRYLDDTNIDIGQDFKQLAAYLHDHGIAKVKGIYHPMHFLPYVAQYYGVDFEWMTPAEVRNPLPGWYAVSAQLLQRPAPLTQDPGDHDLRFRWLDRYEPVARIGYSIYLYHFD